MPVIFDPPLGIWKSKVLDTSLRTFERSLRATAEDIKDLAVEKVPKRSGDLSRTIRVEKREVPISEGKSGGYYIRAGNGDITYARAVELGHVTRGKKGQKGTGHVAEKPYLVPAIAETPFRKA